MAIVLDNITYTYGVGTPFEKTALKGISVTIEMVNFLALLDILGQVNPHLCNISTVCCILRLVR